MQQRIEELQEEVKTSALTVNSERQSCNSFVMELQTERELHETPKEQLLEATSSLEGVKGELAVARSTLFAQEGEIASLKTVNGKIQAELDELQMYYKEQQELLRDQSTLLQASEVDIEKLLKLVQNSNETIKELQDMIKEKDKLVDATQEHFEKAMDLAEANQKDNTTLRNDLCDALKKLNEELDRSYLRYAPQNDV